jgi:hypothetical protein
MSGSGVVILLVLVAGGLVWFSLARRRTREREAALARLAPLISGTVSSKDHGVRGTYRGHDVEARVSKHDPTPSGLGDSSPDEVVVFQLRLGGVAGREPWACRRQPRLKPFADPEYVFDWSYGGVGAPFAALLGKVADVPEHDPALEQRLREAGLPETVDGFGQGSSSFLPRVRFTPALHDRGGELFCELELRSETDPSLERFGELLDRALEVVEINSRSNPAH